MHWDAPQLSACRFWLVFSRKLNFCSPVVCLLGIFNHKDVESPWLISSQYLLATKTNLTDVKALRIIKFLYPAGKSVSGLGRGVQAEEALRGCQVVIFCLLLGVVPVSHLIKLLTPDPGESL